MAAVDLTRLNHMTSYDGLPPEQSLAAAVIIQAIHDLESRNEVARFEAHEFFLQESGPWADMRRFYFQAIQIDEAVVHEAFKQRLDPPERPEKKCTAQEVAAATPRNRTFKAKEMQRLTGLSYLQMGSRIQALMNAGEIVRVERGIYCHASYEATYCNTTVYFQHRFKLGRIAVKLSRSLIACHKSVSKHAL